MRFLFCLIAAVLSGVAYTQDMRDMIVTTGGDSLQCDIQRVGKKAVSFRMMRHGELLHGKLALSRISHYHLAEDPQPAAPVITPDTLPAHHRQKPEKDTVSYPKVRWSMAGGLGYRTGKISPEVPDFLHSYIQSLRKGRCFGVHGTRFVTRSFGIGVKVDRYRSNARYEGNVTVTYDDGTEETGALSDEITITYLGPSLAWRLLTKDRRNSVLGYLSAGWIHYKDAAVLVREITLSSNTTGVSFGLEYEAQLSGGVYLGVGAGYTWGVLSYYDIEPSLPDERVELSGGTLEDVSRLDLSLGLRINL